MTRRSIKLAEASIIAFIAAGAAIVFGVSGFVLPLFAASIVLAVAASVS